MNKLGVSYSGYNPVIPLGNRISMNMKLDDYQKGSFLARRPCDHDIPSKYIYIDMRTYSQQIEDAVAAKPEEIFLLLDTPSSNFTEIESFLPFLIGNIWNRGYRKHIIFSCINEPLEHCTVAEIHNLNKRMSKVADVYSSVYFAVGEMATNYPDYWKSFLKCKYEYDYISFHTDDNCSISDLKKFLAIFPDGTKFINNEHYYYAGAKKLGYNNMQIVKQFIDYTKFIIKDGRIKSIYTCMPFHAKAQGKYPWLGLNTVDLKTGVIYPSVAWNELKKLDIKEVILSKLRELKECDSGFEVRALQYCLNAANESNLTANGYFYPNVKKELVKFNEKHNIVNPAICSYETWFELLQNINCEMYITDLLRLLDYV